MSTSELPVVEPNRKRPNWRLRGLVAFMAVALGLYVFINLDRSVAERLGPGGEWVYDLFYHPASSRSPGKPSSVSLEARRLAEDVKALGGHAQLQVGKPGPSWSFGDRAWFDVSFRNPEFDDAALGRFAEMHGGRIGNLSLMNTGVTDAGLKSLGRFTMLRGLGIINDPLRKLRGIPVPRAKITEAGMVHLKGLDHLRSLSLGDLPITDAGMVHLKGLDHLGSLSLSDLPITDAGLEVIGDLPELSDLSLIRTRVQGVGLAKLKALPRLWSLRLDGCPITEEGLEALSGATRLLFLSLKGVPLGSEALPRLKAIPRLNYVDLTGCGLRDEEVDALVKSKPGLKVGRR